MLIVVRLGFGRRDVPDRLQQASKVEPVHPLLGRQFDDLAALPRAAVDHLGFVESIDRFGQCIVAGVTLAKACCST